MDTAPATKRGVETGDGQEVGSSVIYRQPEQIITHMVKAQIYHSSTPLSAVRLLTLRLHLHQGGVAEEGFHIHQIKEKARIRPYEPSLTEQTLWKEQSK